MKQAKMKSIYTIVCLAVIVAVLSCAFSVAAGTSGVAYAGSTSVAPGEAGSKMEIYYNHSFTGGFTYSSTIPDSDWGSQVAEGYGVRFYVDYSPKNYDIKFTHSGIAIDINGYNVQSLSFSYPENYMYDFAGGGGGKFNILNGGSVTAQGGENTTFIATVQSGGKLIADGSDMTYYDITVQVGGTLELRNGRISYLSFAQNHKKLSDLLIHGYAFVAHNIDGSVEYYPYSKTNVSTFNATSEGIKGLELKRCTHDSITDSTCDYCNASITSTEALLEAKREIETAKEELTAAIETKASTETVNQAISDLNDAIANAISTSELYSDNKDAALKESLLQSIEQAKTDANTAATNAVNAAKEELTEKIDAKADTTALNKAISDLNDAIDTAKSLSNTYSDDKDAALKESLLQSIEQAKADANTAATNAVNAAKEELTGKIDAKADTAALNKAISDLNDAIDTAKGLSNTYADDKDAALKESLLQSIEQAKADANTAAKNAVKEATKDLNAAIDSKADAKSVEQKVNNLNSSIANAQTVSEQYADAQDALLKEELERELSSAQVALQAAIDALSQRLDSAEKQITNADSQVKLIQTVVYVVCAFVAVLCALIIAMAVVFKRAVKQCMDKANKN